MNLNLDTGDPLVPSSHEVQYLPVTYNLCNVDAHVRIGSLPTTRIINSPSFPLVYFLPLPSPTPSPPRLIFSLFCLSAAFLESVLFFLLFFTFLSHFVHRVLLLRLFRSCLFYFLVFDVIPRVYFLLILSIPPRDAFLMLSSVEEFDSVRHSRNM